MHNREHIHAPRHVGDKVADAVVSMLGSWKFIIIQTIVVAVWIVSNLWLLAHPFDPYPLILLNLVFSTQAAYASPLILMASNRQAAKDRARDDLEALEVDTMSKEQAEIKEISSAVLSLQQQQMTVLNQQSEILELLRTSPTGRKAKT